MSDSIVFTMNPVKEKPKQQYNTKYHQRPVEKRRGGFISKWDPLLSAFLKSGEQTVRVEAEGYTPHQTSDALRRRVVVHALTGVVKSFRAYGYHYIEQEEHVISDLRAYLERIDDGKPREIE